MGTPREDLLRTVIDEEKAKVAQHTAGRSVLVTRLIWEEHGIVDLLMALHDYRTRAVQEELSRTSA